MEGDNSASTVDRSSAVDRRNVENVSRKLTDY